MKKPIQKLLTALPLLLAFESHAEAIKLLSLDATGEQVTADKAGQLIYIPDQKNNALVVVDTNTLLVEHTVSLPGTPEDVALDEVSGNIYVTINSLNEVVNINLQSYVIEDSLSLPTPGNEIVVGENFVYVTSANDSSAGIMRIDKQTGNYAGSFTEGVSTYRRGALELTPDNSKLVFANRGLSPGTVAIYDITGPDPSLIIKNDHGALGSNGQDIAIDPINGDFFSYAVGGGNGAGYSIAKVSSEDMSWMGELVTGAYPRAVLHSINGVTSYTNNTANEVKVWDHTLSQLVDTFAVTGNPKDFAESQNGALLAVISDQEFAIYQVGDYTPVPPEPELAGFVDGATITKAVCVNKTTGQKIKFNLEGSEFDCVSNGLDVTPGDAIRVTLHANMMD